MILQLTGLVIIAWAAVEIGEPLPKTARALLLLLLVGITVVVAQLLPLPSSLWSAGLRGQIGDGFALLQQSHAWYPISLAPYAALDSLLCLIPPLALFCAIVRLGAFRANWLAAAVLTGIVAGIVMGALQVAAPGPASPWYLYAETNRGVAVGFFANANHMADLLVIGLPFVAALAAAGRNRNLQGYSALIAVLTAVAVVLVAGIALNGSLAGFALGVFAAAASVLIIASPSRRLRVPVAVVAGIALVGAIGAIASTSIGNSKIGSDASSSAQTRKEILMTTAKAVRDTMPWGSGLGSFRQVYRLYESPDRVTPEYVIHAHNDYAELVLELGLSGVLLIVVFLGWWTAAVRAAWQTGGGGPFARAASIASAVILVHSLVDFPLRTAAISAAFAMCLALLINRRPAQRKDPNDLRPARHIVVN